MDKPTCPKCGGSNLAKREHRLWLCNKCEMLTDCEDDGTVGRGRPENNASRNEEYAMRKKARRAAHGRR